MNIVAKLIAHVYTASLLFARNLLFKKRFLTLLHFRLKVSTRQPFTMLILIFFRSSSLFTSTNAFVSLVFKLKKGR